MSEHRLGGQTFRTSVERDRFAALRRRYLDLGETHRTRFQACYGALGTADALFARMPDLIDRALTETVTMMASDLAAHRVYDVGDHDLRAALDQSVEGDREAFDRIHRQYLAIIGRAQDAASARLDARDNRAQIVGGGFGVEGAAGGMLIAGAANATLGLLHGVAGAIGSGVGAIGDKRRKQELFADPETRRSLGDFLCASVLLGHGLVAAKVNEANDAAVFEPVAPDARRRSAALVANVDAGRVPEAERAVVLREALALDPFSERAWRCWIDRYGDAQGEAERLSASLGMPEVARYKAELLRARKDALNWNTPEECAVHVTDLERLAIRLGADFTAERRKITARAADLDRQRRTFNGVEHATREQLVAAKAAWFAKRAEDDAAGLAAVNAGTVPAFADTARVGVNAVEEDFGRTIVTAACLALAPWPSALLTLRDGYHSQLRKAALVWMGLLLVISLFSGDIVTITAWGLVSALILFLMGPPRRESPGP